MAEADRLGQEDFLGQERALEALQLGLSVAHHGYNVFAVGPHGVGKRALLERLLGERTSDRPPPDDWCYLHDFGKPHRPRALRLPAGRAAPLAAAMSAVVDDLKVSLRDAFESPDYRARRQQLEAELERRQDRAFQEIELSAAEDSVQVARVEGEFIVTALENGEEIPTADFKRLPEARRRQLDAALERTSERLREMLERFHAWERDANDARRALDRDTTGEVARRLLSAVRADHADQPEVLEHLDAVENDLAGRASDFAEARSSDAAESDWLRQLGAAEEEEASFRRRYLVNVLVEHSGTQGSPVIYEDNPTHSNLVGRIEHRSHLGSAVTDFSRIVAGSLHRARGGCLLIDAVDLLERSHSFRTLKRVLKSQEIRIEPPEESEGNVPSPWLSPDAVPLGETKIVLLGEEHVYYQLCQADPDFVELFKVMAEFDDRVDWGRQTQVRYARVLGALVRKERLRNFDRSALARVIEHASRLAEDAEKLSIRMRPILDLLIEADAMAGRQSAPVVAAEHVQGAIEAQHRRRGRQRDEALEGVRRGTMLINCDGKRVGQTNGLALSMLGESGFGHAIRITARVRIGRGELLDIEREVELGGPIHSKGVMLLSGFLGSRYALGAPLCLAASIAFEQTYAPIEGDSASLAEACALLSALADIALDQSLAVTGSMNQYGEVQAVSGVNEKIEGFFDVCREHGLTGRQGVVVPSSNRHNLMLRRDVVEAVDAGRFRVLAVETVDEAMGLLSGRSTGEREKGGHFPADSVNAAVEARLLAFAAAARSFARGATSQ